MLFNSELLYCLPAESRAKVAQLDSDRISAHQALLTATERWQAAHQRHQRLSHDAAVNEAARNRLNRFDGAEIDAHKVAADRIAADLETAKGELDAAAAARDRATAAYRAFDFLSETAKWLYQEAGAGTAFTHAPVAPPKGTKDYQAAVAGIRAELAEIDAEWRKAETAPAPVADLRAGLMAEIDRLAAEGAPRVRETMRGRADPVRLAELTGISLHTYGSNLPVQTADLTARLDALQAKVPMIDSRLPAFLVWLMRPEIEARIGALIDAAPQDGAMSDAERDAAFASLAEQRISLERVEEALIVQAESAGTIIPRRRDIDARAFLCVAAN